MPGQDRDPGRDLWKAVLVRWAVSGSLTGCTTMPSTTFSHDGTRGHHADADLSRDPNLAAAFTEALPLDRVGQGAPKEATRRRSHQKTSLTYWVLMPIKGLLISEFTNFTIQSRFSCSCVIPIRGLPQS